MLIEHPNQPSTLNHEHLHVNVFDMQPSIFVDIWILCLQGYMPEKSNDIQRISYTWKRMSVRGFILFNFKLAVKLVFQRYI